MRRKKDVEEQAERMGITPEQLCLKQIQRWKNAYRLFTYDTLGMTDEEFEEYVEKKLDERRRGKA